MNTLLSGNIVWGKRGKWGSACHHLNACKVALVQVDIIPSQAAIAAVRKAGKTGRARTGELKEVVEEVRRRQRNPGPDAVRFAWVKAHVEPEAMGRQTRWPNPRLVWVTKRRGWSR